MGQKFLIERVIMGLVYSFVLFVFLLCFFKFMLHICFHYIEKVGNLASFGTDVSPNGFLYGYHW